MSRSNGVLVADLDLNLIRQVRDKWGFQVRVFRVSALMGPLQMTARYEDYAKGLTEYVKPDYKPQVGCPLLSASAQYRQVIRDPALGPQ